MAATDTTSTAHAAMQAVARIYHTYFTGLMLTLVSRRSGDVAVEWVFRVFRHQHHEKFLSSFEKLGLKGMPDAVACAAYHYLSNSVGGVRVEFMRESDTKAWVHFVPPRWIYPGAAICGIPSEVSRAFLRGSLAEGEGDTATCYMAGGAALARRTSWRLTRGLPQQSSAVFEAWNGLLEGFLSVHNRFLVLETVERMDLGDASFTWRVRHMPAAGA
jgi:hypothetical protein